MNEIKDSAHSVLNCYVDRTTDTVYTMIGDISEPGLYVWGNRETVATSGSMGTNAGATEYVGVHHDENEEDPSLLRIPAIKCILQA